MKSNKSVIHVGRGCPAKGGFLPFDKQTGKEAAYCWAKPNLHHNAFTLIELLVVVLIIGILAAVALPQYQVAVAKSRLIQSITMCDAVYKAQEVYKLANGQYTNQFADLDMDVTGGYTATTNETGFNQVNFPKFEVRFGTEFCEGTVYMPNMPRYYYYYNAQKECRILNNEAKGARICKSLGGVYKTSYGDDAVYILP